MVIIMTGDVNLPYRRKYASLKPPTSLQGKEEFQKAFWYCATSANTRSAKPCAVGVVFSLRFIYYYQAGTSTTFHPDTRQASCLVSQSTERRRSIQHGSLFLLAPSVAHETKCTAEQLSTFIFFAWEEMPHFVNFPPMAWLNEIVRSTNVCTVKKSVCRSGRNGIFETA